VLGRADRDFERLMLEIRLASGLAAADLGTDAAAAAADLIDEGLLVERSGRFVLTLQGRLLADLVVRRLTA
jgi:hypothetical protein